MVSPLCLDFKPSAQRGVSQSNTLKCVERVPDSEDTLTASLGELRGQEPDIGLLKRSDGGRHQNVGLRHLEWAISKWLLVDRNLHPGQQGEALENCCHVLPIVCKVCTVVVDVEDLLMEIVTQFLQALKQMLQRIKDFTRDGNTVVEGVCLSFHKTRDNAAYARVAKHLLSELQ
jgi:hypothetical protein